MRGYRDLGGGGGGRVGVLRRVGGVPCLLCMCVCMCVCVYVCVPCLCALPVCPACVPCLCALPVCPAVYVSQTHESPVRGWGAACYRISEEVDVSARLHYLTACGAAVQVTMV